MNQAIELFIGKKNYASFTGTTEYDDYVREVTKIEIVKQDDLIVFKVAGTGFMRYMVRNIVGTLLAYSRGNYSYQDLEDLFNNPEKGKSHYKAPGCGLYLEKVIY